jgi:hypothetical protein
MRLQPLLALSIASLAGCVIARPMNDTGPIRDRTDPTQGMIVGHIRYPGHVIHGVRLYEEGTSYFAMEPRSPRAHVFPNGDFVFENVKPGAWRLLCFYSGGITYALMTHDTKDDPRHLYEVRPGEITYVGSYVTEDGYRIGPAARPQLAEILGGLLPLVRGTFWEQAVKRRLDPTPPRAGAVMPPRKSGQ